MKDYVTDVVVIWQLEDDVSVDDVYTLHIKRMDYNGSHKYRYTLLPSWLPELL
jgi:hypothetical protein